MSAGHVPPADPSEAAWIRLPPIARQVLPNGLTVMVVERRTLPLVTIRLSLRAGASRDPTDLPGLAAFTARLLRQGAAARDARAFAEDIDSIGGHFGAGIGLDQLTVDGEFTTETWDEGLALFTEALLAPRFDDDEITRERQRTIAEIAQSRDDPEHVADRAFQHFLFGSHPYGHPAEGTAASLERMTREDILSFHRGRMVPDGGVLVVVGDVDPDSTLKRVADALSGWSGTGAVPEPPPAAPRVTGRRAVLVHDAGSGQVQYRTGNVGLARRTPHFHALALANTIFGGGFTSRLVREARVNRGLTYGIGSRFLLPMSPGPFVISTFTRNAALGEMHEVVTSQLATLMSSTLGQDEIDAARAYVLGMHVRRLETPEALAASLAETELFGLGLDAITGFRRSLEAVTAQSCRAAIDAGLPDDSLLTVLVGDKDAVGATAATLGDLTVVEADWAEGLSP